jgi:hypothetical protein
MKKSSLLLVAAMGFGVLGPLATRAANEDARPAAPPKAELLSVRIDKPIPGSSGMGRAGTYSGTSLAFWVTYPQGRIIGFDPKASRVESFTDDKGTDLSEPYNQPFSWSRFGPFKDAGYSTQDGRLVEVGGDTTPARGAAKIAFKATLVVLCASGEKTVEQKDLSVKTGGKINIGSLAVTVQQSREESWARQYKMAISLTAIQPRPTSTIPAFNKIAPAPVATLDDPLTSIKEVAFFGPDGEEIRTISSGSSIRHESGETTSTRTYALAEKADVLTVRVTYFGKVEAVKVPLSVETGVGF